jgi:ABC-type tungstate transport system permease subunit
MKKKYTLVSQSDKAGTDNAELQMHKNNNQKMYRDHRGSDFLTHGRCNKFPFGSNQGPIVF